MQTRSTKQSFEVLIDCDFDLVDDCSTNSHAGCQNNITSRNQARGRTIKSSLRDVLLRFVNEKVTAQVFYGHPRYGTFKILRSFATWWPATSNRDQLA